MYLTRPRVWLGGSQEGRLIFEEAISATFFVLSLPAHARDAVDFFVEPAATSSVERAAPTGG